MPNSPAWPLPPHVQIQDFLPRAEHDQLLAWVLANEHEFRPAKLLSSGRGAKSRVEPDVRISLTTRQLGPLADPLERRFRESLCALEQGTGTSAGKGSLELELAAHGDGAHYQPHVDMSFGERRRPVGGREGEDRVLSSVYYFYHEPKAFSGGALRLHRFNARPYDSEPLPDDYVDIEPLQNSIVAFPSWAMHEVRPVHCPSRSFRDYRFAINCWFCRKL